MDIVSHDQNVVQSIYLILLTEVTVLLFLHIITQLSWGVTTEYQEKRKTEQQI